MASSSIPPSAVVADDVRAAAERLQGRIRSTPVLPAGELSRRVGAEVLLKAEALQVTGSFKIRGALNAMLQTSDAERSRGVVAASAGNHAQAVAYAASACDVSALLLMPASAPLAKIAAVQRYGGQVELVEGSYDDAQQAARDVARDRGLKLIHAFDQPEVVAGQGTIGLELAAELDDIDTLVVPIGGGGLIGGIAIAIADACPQRPQIVGVQVEAFASYPASVAASRPIGARGGTTICDGIAVKRPGELTLPLVERHVDRIVTVSDDETAEAMVLLLERSKLVVEGAGAVGVAALMQGRVTNPGRRVVVVLSGGNVDAGLLAECIRLGETAAGRRMVLSTTVSDRPGALAALLGLIAECGANVVDVEHLRDGVDLHVRETAVRLVLGTRGPEHGSEILEAVRKEGFPAT